MTVKYNEAPAPPLPQLISIDVVAGPGQSAHGCKGLRFKGAGDGDLLVEVVSSNGQDLIDSHIAYVALVDLEEAIKQAHRLV